MEPKIVCAANRIILKDGTEIIIPSARHWDNIMHNIIFHIDRDIDETEQGFIDQFGHFYTREEAWVVAEKNNQIIRRVGGDGQKLFSENLY